MPIKPHDLLRVRLTPEGEAELHRRYTAASLPEGLGFDRHQADADGYMLMYFGELQKLYQGDATPDRDTAPTADELLAIMTTGNPWVVDARLAD